MHEHRGAAVAVAVATATFFITVSALVVVLGWLGVSVYAIVKAIGDAAEHPSPTVVIVFFVLLIGTLVTAFLASLALIGRSMTPRKRRPDDDR